MTARHAVAGTAFVLFFAAFGAVAGAGAPRRSPPRPPLILVSFDGFRWDYLDRGLTPNLSRLAEAGVRVRALVPSFPTKTFPNHYTLVTGLLPEHHGIVETR
jgi:predicted AlkP superfamily pyrophosphatase or phosphodiesterase